MSVTPNHISLDFGPEALTFTRNDEVVMSLSADSFIPLKAKSIVQSPTGWPYTGDVKVSLQRMGGMRTITVSNIYWYWSASARPNGANVVALDMIANGLLEAQDLPPNDTLLPAGNFVVNIVGATPNAKNGFKQGFAILDQNGVLTFNYFCDTYSRGTGDFERLAGTCDSVQIHDFVMSWSVKH